MARKTYAESREAQLARARAAVEAGRPAETDVVVAARRQGVVARYDFTEDGLCLECGRPHDAGNRRRLIRPMLGESSIEIAAAWPCFYAWPGARRNWHLTAGARRLCRDLRALREAAVVTVDGNAGT